MISTPQKFKTIHLSILIDFNKMDLTLKILNFTFFFKRPHCDCFYLEPAIFHKVQASLYVHFKLKYLDLIYLFVFFNQTYSGLTLSLVLSDKAFILKPTSTSHRRVHALLHHPDAHTQAYNPCIHLFRVSAQPAIGLEISAHVLLWLLEKKSTYRKGITCYSWQSRKKWKCGTAMACTRDEEATLKPF